MAVQGIANIKHHVRDWDKAIAFYRDSLGLKPSTLIANQWAEFVLPDGGCIGLVAAHDDVTHPPHVMLKVSGLAKLVGDLQAQGGTVLDGPRKQAYGVTALVKDPSGNTVELIEPVTEKSN